MSEMAHPHYPGTPIHSLRTPGEGINDTTALEQAMAAVVNATLRMK